MNYIAIRTCYESVMKAVTWLLEVITIIVEDDNPRLYFGESIWGGGREIETEIF